MRKSEETFLLEPERYEFRAMPMHQFALGRRDFFKIFGAGLAVFAVAKDVSAVQETAPGPHGFHNEELPKEIGAWLHMGEDGTVTGFAGKAEIGQNVRTTLAQTIADELGVAFASVRMVLADTALTPFDAGTFGSRTTATITPQLRKVAAAARDLLVAKAAKQWNLPAEKLVAGDGKVSDPASGKSLRYAELTREDLGPGYTFSHIDGGHSPEEVYHDLKLCYDVSEEGALIALDDYFNPLYPGVCEGAVEFSLRHPRWLRPLVSGYNKVLFQKMGDNVRDVNDAFLKAFPDLKHKTARMWKSPVILVEAPLRWHLDLHASTPERFVPFGSRGDRAHLTPLVERVTAVPGQQLRVEVKVENVSSEAFPTGEGIFGLSYHLLDSSGAVLAHDNERTWFSKALLPGDDQLIPMTVIAPSQPGRYQLEIDLIWEGVMWFKDVGNPTCVMGLEVA